MYFKLQLLITLLVTLLFSGCNTTNKSFNSDTDFKKNTNYDYQRINIKADDFSDQWITLFHCQGNDYWLETNLSFKHGQLQASFSGNPQIPDMPVTGRASQLGSINANYNGKLNTETGELFLTPNQNKSHLPAFRGVYSPNEHKIVARLDSRRWGNCSDVIMAPSNQQKKLEELLAKNELDSSSLFGRSTLGILINNLSNRKSAQKGCDTNSLQWLESYLTNLPRNHTRNNLGKSHVNAMYEDAVFESAFDAKLSELNLQDGQSLANQIGSTMQRCGLSTQNYQNNRQSINNLLLPLSNNVQHSRNEVAISNAGKKLYHHWLMSINALLIQWIDTPDAYVEQKLTALNQLAPSIQMAQMALSPLNTITVSNQLTQTKKHLSSIFIEQQLAEKLANASPQMTYLLELASFGQNNYVHLEEKQQKAMQGKITNKVNQLLPRAVQTWADTKGGIAGYQQLSNWQNQHKPIFSLLTPKVMVLAAKTLRLRQTQLIDELYQSYYKNYQQQILQLPPGLSSLKASKIFEKKIQNDLSPISHLPKMEQFASLRTQRRMQDLAASNHALQQQVAKQSHNVGLNSIQETYLLPEDGNSPAAKQIFEAIATQKKKLSPFNGLSGSEYLNALYSRDIPKLEKLDDAFIKPYQGEYLQTMKLMAPLMDGLAKFAGVNINTGDALEKDLETASLIVPIFAVYLVDYQTRYAKCLEPDAVSFKKTTTSETIYRDGYGSYKYSERHPDRIDKFVVNRRFTDVFNQVGLSNPDSALGNMVDSMFGGNSRINVSDVVKGTRQMMEQFECNSRTIAQMESSMLHFFELYRKEKLQVNNILFNR